MISHPTDDDIPIASSSNTPSLPSASVSNGHDKYLAPAPRVSQRAPSSCSFCYKRKIKCNKSIPCENCIKRGVADSCTREPVIVRGTLVGPPQSMERQPLSQEQVHVLTEAQLRGEIVSLRRRITELEGTGSDTPSSVKGKKRKLSPNPNGGTPLSSSGMGEPAMITAHSMLSFEKGSGNAPQKDGTGELLFPYLDVMGLPQWRNLREMNPQDRTDTGISTTAGFSDDSNLLRPSTSSAPGDYMTLPVPPLPHPRTTPTLPHQSFHSSPASPSGSTPNAPGIPSLHFPLVPPSLNSTPAPPTLHSLNASPHLPLNLLTLVPLAISGELVRKSLTFTNWIHCAVHVPSWLEEHDEWIEGLRNEELEGNGRVGMRGDSWLAVYFAIISSGLYFLDNVLGDHLGLSSEQVATLPHFWFDACLEALHRSNFMSTTPTFEALQVITILPMISHSFGASAYIESLLHLGLRMAQLLGLHLLGPEPESGPTPPGLVRRELGRRIWLLLLIGEGNPALNIPGALFLPQAVTVEPANVNDEDLADVGPLISRPSHEATIVSHMTAAGRRQNIFRHFSDRFYAATSLDDQYTLCVSTDQALLTLLTYFPLLQPTDEPYPENIDINAPFDYVPASRYLWGILGPCGRILVYRTFFGRSYKDERFMEVRQIVLDSARLVLRQRRRPAPSIYKRSWGVSALTVLSAVVLATELIHGKADPETSAELLGDIKFAMDSLPSCGPTSQVVIRGVQLLQKVIDSAPSTEYSPQAQDFAAGAEDFFGPAYEDLPTVEMLWPGISVDGVLEEGAWTATENENWLNTIKTLEQLDGGDMWWNP